MTNDHSPIQFETLTTERLFLKKLTPKILENLFENCSKDEVKELLGLTTDQEFTIEQEKSRGGYKTYDRSILTFLLVLKETKETIGRCGFHNWYAAHQKQNWVMSLPKRCIKERDT